MNWEIVIGAIITGIVTLGVAWIKGYFERKQIEANQDKKLQAQVKILLEEIKGISTVVVNIQSELEHHMSESNFVRDLRDAIRSKSKQLLCSSMGLNQKYKNVLGYWADRIEKFGVDYYENKNRINDKLALEKELKQDIQRDLDDFEIYIDDLIPNIKVIRTKRYSFSKYLNDFQIHNKTHVLVSRLVDNGFENTDKIIKVFVRYIDDYFTSFVTAITAWEGFEDYQFEKEEI